MYFILYSAFFLREIIYLAFFGVSIVQQLKRIQLAISNITNAEFPPWSMVEIKMIWQPAQNLTAIKLQPN
mgnify:CR=1 FL=1